MAFVEAHPCAESERELLELLARTQSEQADWLDARGASQRARILRAGAAVIDEHLDAADAQSRATDEQYERQAAMARAMEGESANGS